MKSIVKNNLEIGQVVKNYKEMCVLLNEPIKKCGNSRICQLRDWERYFKYRKSGHKFIIDEIYNEPSEKIDGRGKSVGSRNNSIYGKYIEKLILDLLVQRYQHEEIDKRKIYMSRDNLLKSLCMVNNNYTFSKVNKKYLSNYIDANIENVKEFFNLNNKNLLDVVEGALNRLENKSLIIWDKVTTVALHEKREITDPYGNKFISYENHRNATDEEKEFILDAETQALESMGLTNKKELFMKDCYKDFNKLVCHFLNELETNILYYYKSYDIVFHKNVIKEQEKIKKYLLEYEERENVQVTLNGITSKSLLENSKDRYKKAIYENKNALGIDKYYYRQEKRKRRSQDTYITDNKNIIKTVIDCKTKDCSHFMINDYNKKEKDIFRKINDII